MRKNYNIALVLRSGGDFGIDDVNLLTKNILKYWKGDVPPNIFCFNNLISSKIETKTFTMIPLPNPQWVGWWSKMNLFSPDLKDYRPFLFMDLDTMVVGDLSKDFFPEDEEALITLENICQKNGIGSGFMQVPNSPKINEVWGIWAKQPMKHARIHRGDQDFIQYVTKQDAFWQKLTKRINTAKPRLRMRTEKPKGLDVIYFHGYPRIPEAAKKYEWVKDYVDGKF